MSKQTWHTVIVGGGPAGIAAAVRAVESGGSVLLVDDNPSPGGQIWRSEEQSSSIREARCWRERLAKSGCEVLRGFRVFDHPAPGVILAESSDSMREIAYRRLILCTGARERFLPFPGWTLPNVMGVGGLQAMVKAGLPIAGKAVTVAGTGPLLLAVAAYLRGHGAKVQLIAEQASFSAVAGLSAALSRRPSKLWQAIGLKLRLARIPYRFGCWPIEAKGEQRLRSVVFRQGTHVFELESEFLACGFHLVPNTELAALIGCEIRDGMVCVNEFQQTSVTNVYCAGEPTGIGGVELALIEGQVAGFAAGDQPQQARQLFAVRHRYQQFASALERAFVLRDDLKNVSRDDTLLCRCEDVSCSKAAECGSWREAKLHTRCGMGPCQGRVCGPAAQFLFGWNIESTRPPVFAARLESLAAREYGPTAQVS